MFALNARARTGTNQGKNLKSNNTLQAYRILSTDHPNMTGLGGFEPPIFSLADRYSFRTKL